MAHVVFYSKTDTKLIGDTEYYRQDIEAFVALGHRVTVCTRYRDIPRHFDLMFIWWWTYALWPVLLARARGKPSIVTGVFNYRFPDTFAGTDYFKRPWWQRLLIRRATTLCTMNLFIDRSELERCSEYFRLRRARHYPCIVHDAYLAGPGPRRRNALFNLAWSGRQNLARKGIPDLLEAIRLLKARGLTTSLTLAGHAGDGLPFLRDTIERLGIADEVTWVGALSRADKIDKLRSFEIYVQPSHHEGFGLATAEAMGCGACVITCDVGAVRSVVGDAAIYVTPGAPDELADAIARAMSDEPLRRRLQAEAVERARQLFRTDAKLAALRDILADLDVA